MFSLSAAGTFAEHEYAFSRVIEGGETIMDGNLVDTAPRQVHNLRFDARFSPQLSAALDLFHVSEYFLDAANTATYPGHDVVNLRIGWQAARRSAHQPARGQPARCRIRGSRGFRLQQLPVFPRARPRAVPVARFRHELKPEERE